MDNDLKTKLLWVGGGVLGMGTVWAIYSRLSKKGGEEDGGWGLGENKSLNPLTETTTFTDRNDLKWSITVTGVGSNWEWKTKYAEKKENPYYKKQSFSGSSTSKAAALAAAKKIVDEAVDPLKIAMPF